MSLADSIAYLLGGKRSGKGWRVPSICHGGDGNNLYIADGDNGLIAVDYSHGCSYKTIMEALELQGLKDKVVFTSQQKHQFKVKQSRMELMKIIWHELHVFHQIIDARMCDKAKRQDANYRKVHPEFKPMPDEPWEREIKSAKTLWKVLGELYGIR